MKIYNNLPYGGADEVCKFDLYLPEQEGYDTVVYFHGGGLEGGTKADPYYVDMAKSFAERGIAFASVEYRKYPKAKYPDYIVDCATATAFVLSNIKDYGGNGNIYVSGQSAGAWLSLMLCFNKKFFADAGVDREKILGYVIDSAQTTSHFKVIQEEKGLDELAQRIDEYAPLYYVNKDSEFPKMFLVFYGEDMPCRAEQNLLLYKALLAYNPAARVEYIQLPGGHCAGSTKKDEDGEYPFVKEVFAWLERTKK